jgi:alpha,alpha-trehalase
MKGRNRGVICVLGLLLICAQALAQVAQPAAKGSSGLSDILGYINNGWNTLTRSLDNCETIVDPKLQEHSILYLPAEMPIPPAIKALATKCHLRVENLPVKIERLGTIDTTAITQPGLLYLEHPYVVPGGRFNEMYGWDSYFTILGLLDDGKMEMARGMVDNFLFEVEHYGAVLNANRTYFLTRSQPPFLTSMILAVYEAEKKNGKDDRAWLTRAYQDANKDYQLWMREPHLVAETGLSRYYDFGQGPVPEERATYAEVMQEMFRRMDTKYMEVKSPLHSDWPGFAIFACNEGQNSPPAADCKRMEAVGLTGEYYKGDRSMRESGFDISFRFGPYGADTHHYLPVCLNSLLYKTEKDMERIGTMLGRTAEAQQWQQRAQARQVLVQKYMWDESRGMFFDYNFESQRRSAYEYASTFYPLWAGLATPEQARGVARNLATFEQPGGLLMSPYDTKVQWDYPYGWAPVQLLAIDGLRRYGFQQEANRISYKFISTVVENFRRDGTIREKYNVVSRSSEAPVTAGYKTNVVGFGWTNGVFLELLRQLPRDLAEKVGSGQEKK